MEGKDDIEELTFHPMTPTPPAPDDAATIAMPPVDGSGTGDTPGDGGDSAPRHAHPMWLVPTIAAGVVVVLLAAAGTAYGVVTHREQPVYETAVGRMDDAHGTLRRAITSGETTLREISPKQVKDAKTLDALTTLVKKAKRMRPAAADANRWLLWELKDGESVLEANASRADGMAGRLARAVKTVEASKAAKELDDARNALKKQTDASRKTYDSSNGKVQDDSTRKTLKKLLDEAGKLSSTTPKDYTDKASAVRKATDQVNASVKAKEEADAKAKAEAEAAAAAAAQRAAAARRSTSTYRGTSSGASGYRSYSGGSSYRGTSSGGGSTYRAPSGGSSSSGSSGGSSSGGSHWGGGYIGSVGHGPTSGVCPQSVCGVG